MNRESKGRRQFTAALGAAALAAVLPRVASAQGEKPLQILVGYPPGGSTDSFARLIAAPLQSALGRNVVVQNRPGAGGQIAASALLREGKDGSAILAINQPDLSLVIAKGAGNFKGNEFRTILVDLHEPRVFLVQKESKLDTFAKFVAEAKAKPGQLSISVAGNTAQEIYAQWLVKQLKLDVTIVNYKGGSEAINALLAGDVTANLGDDFNRFNLRSKTTALFIGGDRKSPRWPEADTLKNLLTAYGVSMPSPTFLQRYGVYVVSAEFAEKNPKAYQELQRALLKARTSQMYTEYLERNKLTDLSIGAAGEKYEPVFAAELREIERLAR